MSGIPIPIFRKSEQSFLMRVLMFIKMLPWHIKKSVYDAWFVSGLEVDHWTWAGIRDQQ